MNAYTGSVVALTVFFCSMSQPVGADDESKKTELEGTWNNVKQDSRARQLKFTGDKFEAKIGDDVLKGTFKIDTDENPSQIELKITESTAEKYKDKTALGIYEFQGADLRWCSSQPGRKRRPQQFASQMGDALLLLATFKLNDAR